jgi:hypothetical protein
MPRRRDASLEPEGLCPRCERARAKCKEYYQRNREKIKERARGYYHTYVKKSKQGA